MANEEKKLVEIENLRKYFRSREQTVQVFRQFRMFPSILRKVRH